MGKWESDYGTGNIHLQVSILKKGREKERKIKSHTLLSKAFKMLGQLTGEVGVFKSVLEVCFKVMHSHSAGKFCRSASLCL